MSPLFQILQHLASCWFMAWGVVLDLIFIFVR